MLRLIPFQHAFLHLHLIPHRPFQKKVFHNCSYDYLSVLRYALYPHISNNYAIWTTPSVHSRFIVDEIP